MRYMVLDTDRSPIRGYLSSPLVFKSSITGEQIPNCKRGVIAWIMHLFGIYVRLYTTVGTLYFSLKTVRAIVGDKRQQNEGPGHAFARVLHDRENRAQESLEENPPLPLPQGSGIDPVFRAQKEAVAQQAKLEADAQRPRPGGPVYVNGQHQRYWIYDDKLIARKKEGGGPVYSSTDGTIMKGFMYDDNLTPHCIE